MRRRGCVAAANQLTGVLLHLKGTEVSSGGGRLVSAIIGGSDTGDCS